MELVNNLFDCNFHSNLAKDFLKNLEHHKYWFQLNFRADFKCRTRNINCYEPLNQESICSESQIKIIKVAQSQKVFSIWSQSQLSSTFQLVNDSNSPPLVQWGHFYITLFSEVQRKD